MKKTNSKGYAILGILFVLLSVIAFVIPTLKTGTFWIAYIFTVVAFAAQIVIWKKAFGRDDTLKSKFLGLPVIHISIVYLVVQIIAFVIFTAMPLLPMWSAVVACAVILGFSAVVMIAADTGRDEVERVEAKVQKKVFYIKAIQVDVEMLAGEENDPATKTALNQLAEKIRFSDPMSCDELSELEEQIAQRIAMLKTADDKQPVIKELDLLLTERNKKCKILK